MLDNRLYRPRLVLGVTILRGADGHPMLYNSGRGTYVRLSPLGARTACLLDGTRTLDDVVELLAPLKQSQLRPNLERFLTDLQAAGALEAEPCPPGQKTQWLDRVLDKLVVTIPVVRNLDALAGWLGHKVGRTPARYRLWLLLAAAVTALPLIAWSLVVSPLRVGSLPPLPIFFGFVALHLICHELSHVAACGLVGARVREAGVMLVLGFIPMLYIDHTDSYRLERRSDRAVIALAGPAFDLVAAGLTSAMGLLLAGAAATLLRCLTTAQMCILLINCNPLVPSDGYHALEAMTGEINFRQRAFRYVRLKLMRRPLPTVMASLSPRRRWAYMGYATGALAYAGFVAAVLGRGLVNQLLRMALQ